MKRRRGDDDAKTHPHARALEPRAEGSADAIFRSFVQRSSGVPAVPPDTAGRDSVARDTLPPETGTSPDTTPADGVPLGDEESSAPAGDATDPRIPFRWVETVEMLLEQGRSEVQREEAVTRLTPAEGVMLLTARKTAPPETRAPAPHELDDEDDVRTVSIQSSRLVEELRRAGPPSPETQVVPNLPSRAPTVIERPASTRLRAQPDPVELERRPAERTGSGRIPAQLEPPPEILERPRTGSGRLPAQLEPPPEVLERPRTGSGRIRAPIETPSEPIELRVPSSSPPKKSNSRPPIAEPAPSNEPWESVVRAPSETTQRREALKLVPDVAQVPVAAPPPSERSEDGLIPSGLLDRKLTDMAVLLRYGHEAQVRHELEQLRVRYPQDLLLARRIAEFYLTHERPALALDQLFSLATGLFERRNVEGMKQALEQVLVIDPQNERASRLLGLLEQRPSDPPPPRKPR